MLRSPETAILFFKFQLKRIFSFFCSLCHNWHFVRPWPCVVDSIIKIKSKVKNWVISPLKNTQSGSLSYQENRLHPGVINLFNGSLFKKIRHRFLDRLTNFQSGRFNRHEESKRSIWRQQQDSKATARGQHEDNKRTAKLQQGDNMKTTRGQQNYGKRLIWRQQEDSKTTARG